MNKIFLDINCFLASFERNWIGMKKKPAGTWDLGSGKDGEVEHAYYQCYGPGTATVMHSSTGSGSGFRPRPYINWNKRSQKSKLVASFLLLALKRQDFVQIFVVKKLF